MFDIDIYQRGIRMALNIAEYEATIRRLHEANDRHVRLVAQTRQTVHTMLNVAFFLPPPARTWISATMEDVVAADHNVFERIRDTLASAWVPFAMSDRAVRWTELGSLVSTVAGNLQPVNRDIDVRWRGAAAEAYEAVAAAHQQAATRMCDVAERTQMALSWMSNIGAALFIGLGVLMLKLVAGVAAAFIGVSSTIGIPAALGVMITIVATVAAEVASMIALFVATYMWGRVQMNNMVSEAFDHSAFPDGAWPVAAAHGYEDATVTDADAEWSMRR